MITGCVMAGSADASVIVVAPPGRIENTMLSRSAVAFALVIAARNDPAPESAFVVTGMIAADAAAGSARRIRAARVAARERPCMGAILAACRGSVNAYTRPHGDGGNVSDRPR